MQIIVAVYYVYISIYFIIIDVGSLHIKNILSGIFPILWACFSGLD